MAAAGVARATPQFLGQVRDVVQLAQDEVARQQASLLSEWQAFVQRRALVRELNDLQRALRGSDHESFVSAVPAQALALPPWASFGLPAAYPPDRNTPEGFLLVGEGGDWFESLVSYVKGDAAGRESPPVETDIQGVDPQQWQRCVVVTGGRNSDDGVLARAEGFSPSTASWMQLPPMRRRRCGHAAVPCGGRLVVLGGWDAGKHPMRTAEAYDPQAGRWRDLPEMPAERAHCCAVALGDSVVVMGGCAAGPMARVDQLPLPAGDWRPLPPLQLPRFGAAACVLDGRPVVVGGVGPEGVTAKAERYNAAQGVWRPVADLLTRRAFCACAELNGRVVVVGGCDQDYHRLSSVEEYSPTENAWYFLPRMLRRRQGCSAVVVEGRLVVIGGWDGERELDVAEAYDPFTQTWELVLSLPWECADGAAVVLPLPGAGPGLPGSVGRGRPWEAAVAVGGGASVAGPPPTAQPQSCPVTPSQRTATGFCGSPGAPLSPALPRLHRPAPDDKEPTSSQTPASAPRPTPPAASPPPPAQSPAVPVVVTTAAPPSAGPSPTPTRPLFKVKTPAAPSQETIPQDGQGCAAEPEISLRQSNWTPGPLFDKKSTTSLQGRSALLFGPRRKSAGAELSRSGDRVDVPPRAAEAQQPATTTSTPPPAPPLPPPPPFELPAALQRPPPEAPPPRRPPVPSFAPPPPAAAAPEVDLEWLLQRSVADLAGQPPGLEP